MISRRNVLDNQLLITFLAVVDCGSFAGAAEQLALTPAAVSGQIKRLERQTSARLFARTTRTVRLTATGELLLTYARSIVSIEREARQRLFGETLDGHIRIGATEDFASLWLPLALKEFRHQYPMARFELRVGLTSHLLTEMEAGELDVVFGKQCQINPDHGRLLWQENLVWAFGAREEFSLGSVIPLAVLSDPCVYRWAALNSLDRAGQQWGVLVESQSLAACRAAARSGIAVTPLVKSQVSDGLRVLSKREGLPDLPRIGFYSFSNDGRTLIDALISHVRTAQRRIQNCGV